jgi:hypothetical protein
MADVMAVSVAVIFQLLGLLLTWPGGEANKQIDESALQARNITNEMQTTAILVTSSHCRQCLAYLGTAVFEDDELMSMTEPRHTITFCEKNG